MYNVRTTIGALATYIVLVLLLVACGPSAQSPKADGEKEVPKTRSDTATLEDGRVRGGKFQSGGGSFANPNDPHLVATASGRGLAVPVTDQLVKINIYDPNFGIIPDLAKSWEVAPDGLAYTFKLQQGVKFHSVAPTNGREFTSEDAKYSLMRITADPSVIVEKWKARFQRRLEFGKIKSIETPDKYTLVVKLEEPFAPFMDSISQFGTVMLPREFIEKFPEKIILEGMVGTGPFIAVDYRDRLLATYKRNPDYWKQDSQGQQLPYLDEMAFVGFSDTQAQLAAFRAGQLDATGGTELNAGAVVSIVKDNPGTKVVITPTAGIFNFRLNTKFPAFQDARVRRAIHLAVDRYQFLEVIGEGRGVISGPITGNVGGLGNTTDWLLSQPGYRKDKTQDMEDAKRLMKEAGYESGFEMGGLFGAGGSIADEVALFQQQFKLINITLNAQIVDGEGVWIPRVSAWDFDTAYRGTAVSIDPDSLLTTHLSTGGGRNYGKYSDPVMDDLIRRQKAIVNPEERKKALQDAEKRIMETSPISSTYITKNISMAHSWVHNAGNGPLASSVPLMLEQAWVEKH
ncbi:MAG: ABC transporter substrate-binding protein [Dehalococcoidia bacterium]|nr:ABC transporter substrate-binding protein [Dehalococcoidia bacterium]